MMGELSLDGNLERVKGVLPMAVNAKDDGFRGIILPEQNAKEAGVISGIDVFGMKNIRQVVDFLRGENICQSGQGRSGGYISGSDKSLRFRFLRS